MHKYGSELKGAYYSKLVLMKLSYAMHLYQKAYGQNPALTHCL